MDKSRALTLLSSGISASQVASALGVTNSALSQLLHEPVFAEELATARFSTLRKNNARDEDIDALEDSIIAGLKKTIPLVMRPMELARIFQIINSAKRRGVTAPQTISESAPVVKLSMPNVIVNKFTLNVHNQVISTGAQDLLTIQSGHMSKLSTPPPPTPLPESIQNVEPLRTSPPVKESTSTEFRIISSEALGFSEST